MRLLLIADTYPPARISGALQMRDLACAMVAQGHRPVVLTPTSDAAAAGLTQFDGVEVLRVRAPRTKDVAYWRRALSEIALPWLLLRGLRQSRLAAECWDGLVWYSPSIFLGPLIKTLRKRAGCPSYLIVRDLFPDWAVDAGVLQKSGLAYRFFKAVERFQYRQASVIGVQTPSNATLVARDAPRSARIEVLHNWLAAPMPTRAAGAPKLDKLQGRINFVYAGNMGVAQDMDAFVALAEGMRGRTDIGFLFVGRGSETARLKAMAAKMGNFLVCDEVEPAHLQALLEKCHVGIVALHYAHGTHNIPGKLLTYLHAGLPILARVNPGNDLVRLVEEEDVGLVVEGDNPAQLQKHAHRLAEDAVLRERMGEKGRRLGEKMFSPGAAAIKILESMSRSNLC